MEVRLGIGGRSAGAHQVRTVLLKVLCTTSNGLRSTTTVAAAERLLAKRDARPVPNLVDKGLRITAPRDALHFQVWVAAIKVAEALHLAHGETCVARERTGARFRSPRLQCA